MINLYDFDGTIYDGDSTVDFYFFCLRKKPIIIFYLPLFIIYAFLYFVGFVKKSVMKEKFFKFLGKISSVDSYVDEFWKFNSKKIKNFYIGQDHSNDIIISASPYFLLKPICNKLKVKKLIASPVNKDTGKYEGNNCDGEEKVVRLEKECGKVKVNEVYSDSYKDVPIWKLGKKAYLVKKDKITLLKKDMLEEKKKEKLKKIFVLLLTFSLMSLNFLLVGDYNLLFYRYLVILSFLFSLLVSLIIVDNIFINFEKKYFLVAIFVSLYTISCIKEYSKSGVVFFRNILNTYFNVYLSYNFCRALLCVVALFSTVILIYFFIKKMVPFVKSEYANLEKFDKKIIVCFVTIGFILTLVIYNLTNVFYLPVYDRQYGVDFDVIYTTDTGTLVNTNAYMKIGAPENDFRQPLFGLFSLPFSVSAKFISQFISFIPNSYYIVFTSIQIFLLCLSILMIKKMLNISDEKFIFYSLFLSTYTLVVFPFVYEQYIIALFYLILTMYLGFYNKFKINYIYCGAVGTLLTSGIIFPLISKYNSLKKWIVNIFKCFVFYITLLVLSGQFLLLFNIVEKVKFLMRFSGGKMTFWEKFVQYTHFIKSIFIKPFTGVVFFESFPRYWLLPVKNISYVGIIILVLCVISFIINRKNKFAVISFFWIIFSFVILCLIGWGTKENGLILYSLYFFWAYCALLVMLIDKIRDSRIKYSLVSILVILLLVYNVSGLLDIIKFGIKYYPIIN